MTAFDPWLGEASLPEYDPEKVYHAATDKRGHSSTIKINVASGVPGEIAAIVMQSPELRTVQDFYRDAIAHAIYRWKERLGRDLPNDWGNSVIQKFIMEDTQEKAKLDQSIVDGYRDLMRSVTTTRQRETAMLQARIASDFITDPELAEQLRNLR